MGEVPRGIRPLHLAKERPCAVKSVVDRTCARRTGWSSCRAGEKALDLRQSVGPLDPAVAGQKLPRHDSGQRRNLRLLRLDVNRLNDDELVIDERKYDKVAPNYLRTMLIPKREIS